MLDVKFSSDFCAFEFKSFFISDDGKNIKEADLLEHEL